MKRPGGIYGGGKWFSGGGEKMTLTIRKELEKKGTRKENGPGEQKGEKNKYYRGAGSDEKP